MVFGPSRRVLTPGRGSASSRRSGPFLFGLELDAVIAGIRVAVIEITVEYLIRNAVGKGGAGGSASLQIAAGITLHGIVSHRFRVQRATSPVIISLMV